MIDNKNIFSCEELDHERSEEGGFIEKLQIGFGLILVAWSLLNYIIIPLFEKTPIYKKMLQKKEEKRKEILKKEHEQYEKRKSEEEQKFNEIKNHPEIKRLQNEISKMISLADKLGKTVTPALKTNMKDLDPKHHLEFYDCSNDEDRHSDIFEILWGKCIKIAKSINDKSSVDIHFEIFSFGVDGLKQYMNDESYEDSGECLEFNKRFENIVEECCKKLSIPITENWGRGSLKMNPNTIYYDKYWAGDHHGTVQSLVETIHLDFSK